MAVDAWLHFAGQLPQPARLTLLEGALTQPYLAASFSDVWRDEPENDAAGQQQHAAPTALTSLLFLSLSLFLLCALFFL